MVERVLADQFAHRAFAFGNLGGDGFHIAEDGGEPRAVFLEKIGKRPEQVLNAVAGKAFGEVFHARGHAFEFDHQRVEVRLLLRLDECVVFHLAPGGRAEADGDEVLPHQPGEFDHGFAVGLHVGFALVQFHRDVHLVFGQFDFFDAPNLHAGHFDRVAFFEFLHGVEPGVNAFSVFEEIEAAEHFHDQKRGNQREGEKDSQPGFEGVFHTDVLSLLWLKSAVRNF